VMLQWWNGSGWLILDMWYVLAKCLADFSQSQAKTKIVCRQHTKRGTAEAISFHHMGLMSYGTMFKRLCVADFGHAMCSCHCRWPKEG
jgi:hypothetical protein